MALYTTSRAFLLSLLASMLFTAPSISQDIRRANIPQPPPDTILTVTPGDGLPSLESIGLTSQMLIQPWFLESIGILTGVPNGLGKRQGSFRCLTGVTGTGSDVTGAIACAAYLTALGETRCNVPRRATFCTATVLASNGWPIYTYIDAVSAKVVEASSYCRDVAGGVVWSVDQCTQDNDLYGIPLRLTNGEQTAIGNGEIIVQTTGYPAWQRTSDPLQ